MLLAIAWTNLGFAQSESYPIRISKVDISDFPEISLDLIVLDSKGGVAVDLSALYLAEDGIPVTDVISETVKVGSEVVFVIDANEDIEERDEAGGPSRREKVRDSIHRFVDRYMDPDNLDRISIIVPDKLSGRFLDEPGLVFQNSIRNAINFYVPDELGATPLQDMLEMAIQQAGVGSSEGRTPAVVLFSDSSRLNEQLDFETLIDQAQANQVVIYGAILGSSADPWEIDDIQKLTEPSGGSYVHLPEVEEADPLFDLIRDRSKATRIKYRSHLNTSGRHTLQAELDGNTGEAVVDLVVAPPGVSLSVDNSLPIIRATADATTPLEEIEPRIQPLGAVVSWPDGHPRQLVEALLIVDGFPQPAIDPVLDSSGLLTFDWHIGDLDSGVYAIQIQIEDELGLSGVSDPLPMTVQIDQPEFQPTETPVPSPTPEPTPVPLPTATPAPTPLFDLARDNALYLGSGIGLILLVVIAILAVVLLRRSRRSRGRVDGSQASDDPQGRHPETDATFAILPDFAMAQSIGAYLEALENAPEHTKLIPLTGSNVSMGRDPKEAQISFNDRSVSRLHARILESHGSYRIYDEGSTSGTFVNYERIGLTPRVLDNRDEIHLGRVHLRFHQIASSQNETQKQVAEPGLDETQVNQGNQG